MKSKRQDSSEETLDASFSVLTMSIASSAAMSMGLEPDPKTGKINIDIKIAKFSIDLLLILQQKTKGNLTVDEAKFIDAVINDLRLKFLLASKT